MSDAYQTGVPAANIDTSLLRNHNANLPISRLPNELLVKIFRLNAQVHILTNPKHYTLSQVCHHWRAVALSTPELWSRIVIPTSTRVAVLEEWMRRSKQAPLEVDIFYPSDEIMLKVLRQLARVRKLRLYTSSCEQISVTFRPRTGFTSILEELNTNLPVASRTLGNRDKTTKSLAANFPKLRKIVLEGFPCKLESRSLPSTLISLAWSASLADFIAPSRIVLTLGDILGTLERISYIEDLSMDLVTLQGSGVVVAIPEHEPKQITFPRLQKLSLLDCRESALELLDCFALPSLRSWDFVISLKTYEVLDDHPVLFQHVQSMQEQPRTVAAGFVKGSQECNFIIRAWHQVRSWEQIKSSLRLDFDSRDVPTSISFELSARERASVNGAGDLLLERLMNSLSSSNVETLYLRLDRPELPYLTAMEAFGRMGKLQTLHVEGLTGNETTVRALVKILDPREEAIFPELRIIHFQAVSFDEPYQLDFVEALKARQNTIHRIERLVLHECDDLTEEFVEYLREIIEVDCDHDFEDETWYYAFL